MKSMQIFFAVSLILILEEWHHDQHSWNAWKSNKNDSSEYKMPTQQCPAITQPTQIYPNEDDFHLCKQSLSDFFFSFRLTDYGFTVSNNGTKFYYSVVEIYPNG
jgi:hypothetical protein